MNAVNCKAGCLELFESLLNSSVLLLCLLPLPPLSQEGDDYEVVPNSKFYVSRTANRDSSSYYHIDGKKATFKEVGTLLRSHGIDLDHNRFLILQVIVFLLLLFLFFYPSYDHPSVYQSLCLIPFPGDSFKILFYALPVSVCVCVLGVVCVWGWNNLLHWSWKEEERRGECSAIP